MARQQLKVADSTAVINSLINKAYALSVQAKSKRNAITSNPGLTPEYKNTQCDNIDSEYKIQIESYYSNIIAEIDKIEKALEQAETEPVFNDKEFQNAVSLIKTMQPLAEPIKSAIDFDNPGRYFTEVRVYETLEKEIAETFRGCTKALAILKSLFNCKGFSAGLTNSLIFISSDLCEELVSCVNGIMSGPVDNGIAYYQTVKKLNEIRYLTGTDSEVRTDVDMEEQYNNLSRLAMGLPL